MGVFVLKIVAKLPRFHNATSDHLNGKKSAKIVLLEAFLEIES
jgi:hypothetical protein